MLLRRVFLLLLPSFAAFAADDPKSLEAIVETSLGSFRLEFAPAVAPKHVEQFLRLARAGEYNGGAFHRVMANAIIQGGDPLLKNPKTPRNLWGTGGLNLLASEFSGMLHERGVVSTVRIPNRPNSDGMQFFVCVTAQPALDGQYTAFGRVTEGMEVVDAISRVPVDANGAAETPVRILSVRLDKKKIEPFFDTPLEQLRRVVRLETTLGTLRIETRPDWAPGHVRNFLKLASTGWYKGTSFHRIAKGFVVQGGMSNTRPGGAGHAADRWVHPLKAEFSPDLKHVKGMVSMARHDEPDSATTSFFLMLGDAPHLDGQYSLFARVVEGLEVLDAFEKEDVEGDTPKRRLEIVDIRIEEPKPIAPALR